MMNQISVLGILFIVSLIGIQFAESCVLHSDCDGGLCLNKKCLNIPTKINQPEKKYPDLPSFKSLDPRIFKPRKGGYCTSDEDCFLQSHCSENTCKTMFNFDEIPQIPEIDSRISKPRTGGYCTSNEDCHTFSRCSGNTCKDDLIFNPILGDGEISTSQVPDPNNELFDKDCSYDSQCRQIHTNAVCYKKNCMCYITEYVGYRMKKLTYVNNITYCGSTMMIQPTLTLTGLMLLIVISIASLNG